MDFKDKLQKLIAGSRGVGPEPPNYQLMGESIGQLFTPENLMNAPYQFRYGMNAPEKIALADSGIPLGVSPEMAQQMPAEADRAAAIYAGTKKWGKYFPMVLNEIRNYSGIAQMMGEDPEMQDRLREAAIIAQSLALARKPPQY